jgi:flavin reductase (DIM6/NTAB) family NADH-FMN oxidoreductase RutF
LYFGTPVVLLSTANENGSFNLAPISSAFWLGWRCIIGLSSFSKTSENLMRTKECVINLPSVNEVEYVNRLALTTGRDPVPERKYQRGYRYHQDKFALAGFTPQASLAVTPPRVMQCPVQLEAKLEDAHSIAADDEQQRGRLFTYELRIVRVHLHESILMDGHRNRVDPDKWKPLIMSFQQFYSLTPRVHTSTLAQVPEEFYQTPDMERAKKYHEFSTTS